MYGGFVIPSRIIILSWFFNSSHRDINSYEILEFMSLPYAPVSSEVSQIYLTPSETTVETLEVIASGAYERSFPLANTVLQYVHAPKQPALIGILNQKTSTFRCPYFSLF